MDLFLAHTIPLPPPLLEYDLLGNGISHHNALESLVQSEQVYLFLQTNLHRDYALTDSSYPIGEPPILRTHQKAMTL